MLFQTYTFLLGFLPVAFIGYELLSRLRSTRLLLAWLTVCSLVFYAWGEPRFVWIFVTSILCNYAIAEYIVRASNCRKVALGIAITANLLLLGYYKYAGFFAGTAGIEISFLSAALPLAISFFTFQQITFLMEVYRGETEHMSLLNYIAYISFFPQLIAGPIVRPHELVPQLISAPASEALAKRLSIGITYLAIGLFKKVVIADHIKIYSDSVFQAAQSDVGIPFFLAWCGTLAFTFYIYFDFSAYSDMAIGLARFFGFKLPVNFNAPYRALSITEFWRRWHITLSNFLRDYVYIPLGGSRSGSVRTLVNVLLTMLVSGLWHGAGWTFVAWGLAHGIAMCLHRVWSRYIGMTLWKPLAWLLTFITLACTWTLFRAETFGQAWRILVGMTGLNGFAISQGFQGVSTRLFAYTWNEPDGSTSAFVLDNWADNNVLWWISALMFVTFFLPSAYEFMRRWDENNEQQDAALQPLLGAWIQWRPSVSYGVIIGSLLIASLYYMLFSTPEPFLYFRF